MNRHVRSERGRYIIIISRNKVQTEVLKQVIVRKGVSKTNINLIHVTYEDSSTSVSSMCGVKKDFSLGVGEHQDYALGL